MKLFLLWAIMVLALFNVSRTEQLRQQVNRANANTRYYWALESAVGMDRDAFEDAYLKKCPEPDVPDTYHLDHMRCFGEYGPIPCFGGDR